MHDGQSLESAIFWELLAPLQKKLYNFLHKSLGYAEESGDIYQEVVLRAFRYFPGFDRSRSFPAWIFAIAHNELKRHFRRLGAVPASLSTLANEPAAAQGDPQVVAIHAAARRLPLRQREVFFLYYYNEFTVADVAAITGLSAANVKFILHRARAAVREILEVGHGTR